MGQGRPWRPLRLPGRPALDEADEEWRPALEAPRDDFGVVETGARHFIACLRGMETPVLTAEHGRHVLDVILQAYASIADGRVHEVETTFLQERPDSAR